MTSLPLSPPTLRHSCPALLLAAALVSALPLVRAQVTITAVNTTTNTTAPSTTETGTNPGTLTYQNDIRNINTFTAGGTNYYIAGSATDAFVRRNAVNSNNSSLWVADVNATTVVGTDKDTYSSVLRDNNIFQGSDNVFVNGTTASQGNIERVDFVWNSGIAVQASDGFAIFDRGAAAAHDAVQVAVITSLGSGLASPLTWGFGTVLELSAASYGANLDLDNSGGAADTIAYRLLRFGGTGDTLTAHTDATATGSQGLAGSFIRFSDLGITSGTTIYGYAIMGSDVTNTSASLADWSTAAFYPTNTADATGGIDLASFNGQISRVPEPATYGALVIGLSVALVGWRRSRRPAALS